MRRRLLGLVLVIVFSVGTVGCSSADSSVDDAVDQVANIVQSDDENVLSVKGGTNSNYPGVTYEEAFEEFFADPTWKYFKGTQDGPDDDGDGEPDYTKTDIDVVEFTGRCTYQDVEVKALIQFTLDKEAGTFDAAYLSFNEVPQSSLMLSALISTAFESYIENHSTTQDNSEVNASEIDTDDKTEDVESESDVAFIQPVLGTYSKEWVDVYVSYATGDDVYTVEIYVYANEDTVSVYLFGDLEMSEDGSYLLHDESNDIYVNFAFYDGGMEATVFEHEDDAYGVINGVYELTEELDLDQVG